MARSSQSRSRSPVLDQLLDVLERQDGDRDIILHARKLSGVCDEEPLPEGDENLPGLILALNQTVAHVTFDALNCGFRSAIDVLTRNTLLLVQRDKGDPS